MTKDPSKIKLCPACRRLSAVATMRPLSRAGRSGVRLVCFECFTEGMARHKELGRAAAK
jgi:hypothetical protein